MQIQRHITAAALAILAGAACAGVPAIDLFTIAGGGGTSTGGDWSITATIGQADAGPGLSGGDWSMAPGFWTVVPAPPPCPADLVEPFGVLDLLDINAFVTGFIGQDDIADLNGDGFFDLVDINEFISSFLRGCDL